MQTIHTVLDNYSIGTITEIETIKTGAENENYLIITDDSRYVLRIYNQYHSIRGLRSQSVCEDELTLMERAQKAGIPTLDILVTVDGKHYFSAEIEQVNRFVMLTRYVEHVPVYHHIQKTSTIIGTVVDQFFEVSKSFEAREYPLIYNIVTRGSDAYKSIERSNVTTIPKAIIALYQRLEQETKIIDFGTFSKGLIHGDIKLNNLLFDAHGELISVLDFDDFRASYILEEACMALMHELHSTKENLLRAGYYENFLDQLTHPTLQAELRYLPYLLGMCFIRDVSVYLRRGLDDLVDELLNDVEIQRYILDASTA